MRRPTTYPYSKTDRYIQGDGVFVKCIFMFFVIVCILERNNSWEYADQDILCHAGRASESFFVQIYEFINKKGCHLTAFLYLSGGETGIWTPEACVARLTVFETAAFSRSAISPFLNGQYLLHIFLSSRTCKKALTVVISSCKSAALLSGSGSVW